MAGITILATIIASGLQLLVPRLLGPFMREYPGIDISLDVGNRSEIVARLTRNEDDLYVMMEPPENTEVVTLRVLPNPVEVIAPADHPLAEVLKAITGVTRALDRALKDDETGEPFHVQQAAQIRAYRQAWTEAGHTRTPRVSVSRSIFALVNDQDRVYFGRQGGQDQFGVIDQYRAVFGRSYADEPDRLRHQPERRRQNAHVAQRRNSQEHNLLAGWPKREELRRAVSRLERQQLRQWKRTVRRRRIGAGLS